MKIRRRSSARGIAGCLLCFTSLAAAPVMARGDSNDWHFAATIYGWFPDIGGHTNLPAGDTTISIDIGTILDHLKITAQGSFEFRKGRWGAYTDIVYLDVGETRNETRNVEIGGVMLPATVTSALEFNLKSTFVTFGATFQLADSPHATSALLFGARLANLDQELDWEFTGDFGPITPPPPTGNRSASTDQWDAILGLRGQFNLGADGKWAVPYHLDIGTGDSDLTWQAVLGISYSFGWGDMGVAWRYLDYDLGSGTAIRDLNFSGPALGLKIRW